MKVSIQGIKGSFHHQAALQYFGQGIDIIACDTFEDVIFNTEKNVDCDAGLMAIHNTIAGTITNNLKLLRKSSIHVVGYITIPIRQQLLAIKGTKINEIKEIQSHYMAINQCLPFLENLNCKIRQTDDTAASASTVQREQLKDVGVIASALAAQLYDLEIIKRDIHSAKNNYTKFLVLQKSPIHYNNTIMQSPLLQSTLN